MKMHGERTAEPETAHLSLVAVEPGKRTLSGISPPKKTGFEEKFGRRYNFELIMGWGNGSNQNYHLGYLGRRDLDDVSLLAYHFGIGINTSQLSPDSLRKRYFSVGTNLIKGIRANSAFYYEDYRYRMPSFYGYQRKATNLMLDNNLTYDFTQHYSAHLYSKVERLSVDQHPISENLLIIKPAMDIEFNEFQVSGGVDIDYSSEFLLSEPHLMYVRNRAWPGLRLDRVLMTVGYVYYNDDFVMKKFLRPNLRLEFAKNLLSLSLSNKYTVFNPIRAFNENRLFISDAPDQNGIEQDKVNVGVELSPGGTPFYASLFYRNVQDFYFWTQPLIGPGYFYNRWPNDTRIWSLILCADFERFSFHIRRDFLSSDIPNYARLAVIANVSQTVFDIFDFGLSANIQEIRNGPPGFLLINANVKKEILKIFSFKFELRNITGKPYEIWPGLEEPGRTYLFSIQTRI